MNVAIPAAVSWKRDRVFFGAMAAAAAATVFAGFARSYFLKGLFGTPALPPLLHLHGALFTTWIALFATQTSLVAARRVDVHRKLGVAGAVLAACMPVVGLMAAIASARRGFSPPGAPPALIFFVVPFFDILMFTSLVGTALVLRRRPETHRRLMLLATVSLLTAAIARVPGMREGGLLAFFGLTDAFVIACFIYDRLAHGRVHTAFWAGGLALIASHPLRLAVGGTAAWLAFAGWVTR
jgi:hypothetical protein